MMLPPPHRMRRMGHPHTGRGENYSRAADEFNCTISLTQRSLATPKQIIYIANGCLETEVLRAQV